MSHQQVLATLLIQALIQALSATCSHLVYGKQCKEVLQGRMHPDQQLGAVYVITGSFVAGPSHCCDQTCMPFLQHLQAHTESWVTPQICNWRAPHKLTIHADAQAASQKHASEHNWLSDCCHTIASMVSVGHQQCSCTDECPDRRKTDCSSFQCSLNVLAPKPTGCAACACKFFVLCKVVCTEAMLLRSTSCLLFNCWPQVASAPRLCLLCARTYRSV